jgi:TATA-binding protein-associated factor
MGVTFARKKANSKIPKFETLEKWGKFKSTKIDVCCRLVAHLLERDDAPPVAFEDGSPIFPPMPPTDPANPPSKLKKIVVFQEFPSFRPLLQNVSTLAST